MDWGDAPAWVAIAVAALALGISWKSYRLQQRVIDEQRLAAAPRPRITLEYAGGTVYRLRNVGDETAYEVTVVDEPTDRFLTCAVPEGEILDPGEAVEFDLICDTSEPTPPQLRVYWTGLEDAVCLPVPQMRHEP